jgi:hypothetical protein
VLIPFESSVSLCPKPAVIERTRTKIYKNLAGYLIPLKRKILKDEEV